MKKVMIALFMAAALAGCNEDATNEEIAMHKAAAASQSNFSDYQITTQVSPDGTLWTYTIAKATNKSKALSHFILDLQNCGEESATFANIAWATVNGAPANLATSEGKGTGCNPQAITQNFVKFDNLSDAAQWVLVVKFDTGYQIAPSTGWIKAGSSCNSGVVMGPGCPIVDFCTYSQGYFFANGAIHNGASEYWTAGLTIGGVTYTQEQGNEIWNIDRGRGGDDTLNAFFQLGAIRLSGVDSHIAADAAIVDAYFNGLSVFSTLVTETQGTTYSYFNLPAVNNGVSKAQLKEAAGRLGQFVEENHCEEAVIEE